MANNPETARSDALQACREASARPFVALLRVERERIKERLVTAALDDIHRGQGAIAALDELIQDLMHERPR